jgi:hypothetical protein
MVFPRHNELGSGLLQGVNESRDEQNYPFS